VVTGLVKTIEFKLATAAFLPKPLNTEKPTFPGLEAVMGLGGACNMRFVINPDGSVSDPEILNSMGSAVFDIACKDAVGSWKFEPPLSAGKPTSVAMYYRLNFSQRGANFTYLKPSQWVTVQYTLQANGTTKDIKAIAQSDEGASTSKAVRQVAQTRFPPIVENGQAVEKPNQTITIRGSAN